ncbi:MAG TPA: glucose-6-phosphate dehydrogenase [Candidatus Eisenbacteria bacterium]|nr:glucose-6-phosphate dehydrogenase [Candidatus Eisenbacteria bacterium]
MTARGADAAAPALEPNPFREGSVTLDTPEPCSIVVFGGTGDLTRRKLIPALLRLAALKCLHPRSAILGVARREMTDDAFREELRSAMLDHAGEAPGSHVAEWERFADRIHYLSGSFDDPALYDALRAKLEGIERQRGLPGTRLYYLAVPPASFGPILRQLGGPGLVRRHGEGPWTRVVIEKPFGHDLESARELNRLVLSVFDERQVFRIDHYLGKESVQNILVLRLANGIFEPLWSNRHVDHVQITVAESLGVEGRAAYYERAGVSRDILQNHLMQLLALTAMEPPARFDAESIRDEKVKALRALAPLSPEDASARTVRAQYESGAIAGSPVPAYREEPGVDRASETETYLALRLDLENWRWAGVPFYLRSGKRLPKRATEIDLVFRHPPYALFRSAGIQGIEPNVLRLRIQPDEGCSFTFGSKSPGQALHIDPVRMDFYYLTSFGADPPEAYERLLLDVNRGDATLFARRDEVELAWEVVDSIAKGWETRGEPPLARYPAGRWGPREADALIQRDGRKWLRL